MAFCNDNTIKQIYSADYMALNEVFKDPWTVVVYVSCLDVSKITLLGSIILNTSWNIKSCIMKAIESLVNKNKIY